MSARPPVQDATLVDCRTMKAVRSPESGFSTWIVRTANFVVELTDVAGSATLRRASQPDEYMVVVPPHLQAVATSGVQSEMTRGDALFIIPPGDSTLQVTGHGLLTRVFSTQARDIATAAFNRIAYSVMPNDVAGLTLWPVPVDGFRLRHYPLADCIDPASISRVFRSTNLMLNIMRAYEKPRDPKVLMPHFHEDCEQITVALSGRFVHHLRKPWGPDSTQWSKDQHLEVGSPSALLIPPRLIHTTQAMEAGCRLIDVFGPPRLDFSRQPRMVRNAAEYPMPEDA